MHISDYQDVSSWLRSNGDREATFDSEWLPDHDELKRVIRMGGVRVEKQRERTGLGKRDWVLFVFKKASTFQFDEKTQDFTF